MKSLLRMLATSRTPHSYVHPRARGAHAARRERYDHEAHFGAIRLVVISVSLSGAELGEFDELVKHFGYDSRSSAVRDALYHFIAQHRIEFQETASVVLTLIYDPSKRQDDVHELLHHEARLIRTSLHQHMGERCIDVLVVHGPGDQVHGLLDRLTTIKDVRVNVSPL